MPRLLIPYDSTLDPDDPDARIPETQCWVVRLVDGTRAKTPDGRVKFFGNRRNAVALADELDGIVEYCDSTRDEGTPSHSARVDKWGKDAEFAMGRAEGRGSKAPAVEPEVAPEPPWTAPTLEPVPEKKQQAPQPAPPKPAQPKAKGRGRGRGK